MTKIPVFEPTEIWTPESANFELGSAIETAQREMNQKNPAQLLHELKGLVKHSDSGIVYAIFKGDHPEDYSDTDALVMFNPFANTATANMLVRAEFIREVAKQASVRDIKGKLKPLIMLASPGLSGSRLRLTGEDKGQIRKGNLGPAAKEYLKTVSALEFGRVALLGYSQGADLAVAGATTAYSANLDREALSIGDPAGVVKRNLKNLAQDFFAAAPDLEARAARSDLIALDEARGVRSDYSRFLISTLYPMNWHELARGMAGNSFEANMQAILDEGKIDKIVVGYGAKSTIAPPGAIEPSLAKLHEEINDDRLISVKVNEGTHAWGEQLTVLAKLYLRALV